MSTGEDIVSTPPSPVSVEPGIARLGNETAGGSGGGKKRKKRRRHHEQERKGGSALNSASSEDPGGGAKNSNDDNKGLSGPDVDLGVSSSNMNGGADGDDLDEGVVVKRESLVLARHRSGSIEVEPAAQPPGVGVLSPPTAGSRHSLLSQGVSISDDRAGDVLHAEEVSPVRRKKKKNKKNKQDRDVSEPPLRVQKPDLNATELEAPAVAGGGGTASSAPAASSASVSQDCTEKEGDTPVKGDIGDSSTPFVREGRLPRKYREQRRGLPIYAHKAAIVRAVKEHQVRPDLP